jgi:cytochrome c biogenesis protein ResB
VKYRNIWKPLASPNLALALIGLLTLAVAAGGTLPQTLRMTAAELNSWQNGWPRLSALFEWSGLSAVWSSWWFSALCVALLVNLAAGIVLHVSYIIVWMRGETAPTYRLCGTGAAPEEVGRSLGLTALPETGTWRRIQGWVGLWGTPLFHAGIIVLVTGALLSASDRFGAHLELSEGETFSGESGKLTRDKFSVASMSEFGALRLDRLNAQVAEGKHLRELQAFFTAQEKGEPPREMMLMVNHPLKIGGYTFYLDKKFGYAAAFERTLPDGSRRELRINFDAPRAKWGAGSPIERDEVVMLDNIPIVYRMALTPGEAPSFRLTAERRGKAVFDGILLPGQMADLGAYRLVFLGAVPWVGLYLTTDRALHIVLAGFVIILAGFLLHLLVRPRRLRLVRGQAGWELEAWAMRDDWLFERQWRCWEAQVQGRGGVR